MASKLVAAQFFFIVLANILLRLSTTKSAVRPMEKRDVVMDWVHSSAVMVFGCYDQGQGRSGRHCREGRDNIKHLTRRYIPVQDGTVFQNNFSGQKELKFHVHKKLIRMLYLMQSITIEADFKEYQISIFKKVPGTCTPRPLDHSSIAALLQKFHLFKN